MNDFKFLCDLTGSAESYYNKASAKSGLEDNYGAIADYSKAIELSPKFSMAYNNRGWSKFKLTNYSEALIDVNKSIELDSLNWVAYDSRQEIKFVLNDFDGCIKDCEKAISINSKVANSYFILGKVYMAKANKTKACTNCSIAGELGKKEAYELISKNCKY